MQDISFFSFLPPWVFCYCCVEPEMPVSVVSLQLLWPFRLQTVRYSINRLVQFVRKSRAEIGRIKTKTNTTTNERRFCHRKCAAGPGRDLWMNCAEEVKQKAGAGASLTGCSRQVAR